jgi:hypothetical protein
MIRSWIMLWQDVIEAGSSNADPGNAGLSRSSPRIPEFSRIYRDIVG